MLCDWGREFFGARSRMTKVEVIEESLQWSVCDCVRTWCFDSEIE